MRGTVVKRLRRARYELPFSLSKQGWRKLKRAYNRTPRPDRHRFDVPSEAMALRMIDVATLRRRHPGTYDALLAKAERKRDEAQEE